MSNILNVLAVDAGHADTTVLHQVDVMLVDKAFTLLFVQTGVREHTDLVGDVVPCA